LTKPQDSFNAGEARCHALGDLAACAADEQPADLRQWAEIEQALAGRPSFLRRRWWALAVPALAGLALWIAAGRTLGWQTQGCALVPNGSLSGAADRVCVVAFDDGTRITLNPGSSARVRGLGFWRGAQLALDHGHAELSVVHRPGCRWEVLTGSIWARVTGTRFEVDWTPGSGHFSLGVSDGEVIVSGDPLRNPTPVRAGHRLDVDTATASVAMGDLVVLPGAQATPARAVAPERPEKTKAELAAPPGPTVRAERRRGVSSKKTAARNLAYFATAKGTDATSEPPAVIPDVGPGVWTASSAQDERRAPAPLGPRRLTIGRNGELVGGATGPIRVLRGSGTTFSKRAYASANHLYVDDGSLCTSGKTPQLACADEAGQPKRCDWDTNWGVLMMWYTREDQKAWGGGASSSIAFEFRGNVGHYRLVAHRAGDPPQRAYCAANYRSGASVRPSDFEDCWSPGAPRLTDFNHIDYFALQLLSEEAWLNFKFCLSAISLP
jgi:FecR protein